MLGVHFGVLPGVLDVLGGVIVVELAGAEKERAQVSPPVSGTAGGVYDLNAWLAGAGNFGPFVDDNDSRWHLFAS